MLARCFCPKHGKLHFDDIYIKDGTLICKKCKSILEFGKVRPRHVEKPKKKKRRKRRKRRKRSKKR